MTIEQLQYFMAIVKYKNFQLLRRNVIFLNRHCQNRSKHWSRNWVG